MSGTRVVCLCMRVTSNQRCPTPPWHSITSTTHFLLRWQSLKLCWLDEILSDDDLCIRCLFPSWSMTNRHSRASLNWFFLSRAHRLTRLTSPPTSPPLRWPLVKINHVLTLQCHSLWRHPRTRGRGIRALEANLARLRLARLHSPPSTRPRAMEQHLRGLPWVGNGIRVLEGFLLLPFTTDLRCPRDQIWWKLNIHSAHSHGVRRMEITRWVVTLYWIAKFVPTIARFSL